MSAARHSLSRSLFAAVAGVAVMATAACTNEVSVPTPEEIPDPGFSGDWKARVAGSEMILRIGEFRGVSAPGGRLIWRDLDWGLACVLDRSVIPEALSCTVTPTIAEDTCVETEGNEPYVDIESASPNRRIVATVGGELRLGAETPCVGEQIMTWDPPAGVTFFPG